MASGAERVGQQENEAAQSPVSPTPPIDPRATSPAVAEARDASSGVTGGSAQRPSTGGGQKPKRKGPRLPNVIPNGGEVSNRGRFDTLTDSTTIVHHGESITVSATDLCFISQLGQGQYGEVVKMEHKPSRLLFAVKKMRSSLNTDEQKALWMDLDVNMRSYKCAYMVRFYGALFREGDVWLMMELMNTSLDKFYKEVYAQHLEIPESILGTISFCVLTALEYMYRDLRLMHRDVKPSNILVNRAGDVKLCDFGISGELINSIAKTDIGCKPYMAPERIDPERERAHGFTIKSDVWSFGITIFELATGKFPYQWSTLFEQLKAVVHGEPPKLPDAARFSSDFREFVALCLTKDVNRRPKYEPLLASSFIKRHALPDPHSADYRSHPQLVEISAFVNLILDNQTTRAGGK